MKLAIIQARMGSSRLPGKVLKMVCGKPMLQLQIERLKQAVRIDRIIVATTLDPADEPVVELCRALDIKCFRGSEEDVLDRFYQAARSQGCGPGDVLIRSTADCPLIDPRVADQVVVLHAASGVDYASNAGPPTYPDGLDIEVFKFDVLEKAWNEAALRSEREHVTPYIRSHPELFTSANLVNSEDLSAMRWTLDEAEDFELIKNIYEHFYPGGQPFYFEDIVDYLRANPHLLDVNRRHSRNEGYAKSLAQDQSGK